MSDYLKTSALSDDEYESDFRDRGEILLYIDVDKCDDVTACLLTIDDRQNIHLKLTTTGAEGSSMYDDCVGYQSITFYGNWLDLLRNGDNLSFYHEKRNLSVDELQHIISGDDECEDDDDANFLTNYSPYSSQQSIIILAIFWAKRNT